MNKATTLWWDATTESLHYIDQTVLPGRYTVTECQTIGHLAAAIRRLEIRGAPALGVAGAYGIALATRVSGKTSWMNFFLKSGRMQRSSKQPARQQ